MRSYHDDSYSLASYYGMQQFGQQQAVLSHFAQQQQVAYENRLRNQQCTLGYAISAGPSIQLAEYCEQVHKRQALDLAELEDCKRKEARALGRARTVRYAWQSLIVGYLASGAAFAFEVASQLPSHDYKLSITSVVASLLCGIPAAVLGINVLSGARR